MELHSLQAFVKVVQAGSFTRAAESLDTHKAQLSRVVSGLEKQLGVRLLERTTRSLSLTEAGREFFERATAILASVDDARQALQRTQTEPQGRLRLTCGVDFGLIAVSGWIADYLARHPKVQVEADFTNRIVDIVHEGFDLAVRVGALPDSSLAARPLGRLTYGLYAAPGCLRRRGVPVQPADLAGHDLVAFSGGASRGPWLLSRPGETQRVKVEPRLSVNSSLAVRDAVLQGQGIGLLPHVVVQGLVQERRLRPVLEDWTLPEVPVHAVFASARFLAPKVRAFIDLAVSTFGAAPQPRRRIRT